MTLQSAEATNAGMTDVRPWYREPWLWFIIAVPAVAVAGGFFTLYLAITHPDPLVIDDARYHDLHTELHAQQPQQAAAAATTPAPGADHHDGER